MSNWLLQLQGLSQNRHQWYQDYSHTYAKEYWTTSYLNICFSNNENSNFTGIYSIWYDKISINKVEIHASSSHQNYFIHVLKRVIHGRRKDIVDFRSSKVNHPNNSIQFVCMHVSHDDANLLYKQVYPKQELIIIRRYEMCHIYWHIQFVFLGMIISFSILKYFSFHHTYYRNMLYSKILSKVIQNPV